MFSQTPFCAWGSCQTIQKQVKDGKAKWQTLDCPLLTGNYWESMENQMSSSVMYSQDLPHCRFFRRPRLICKHETLNLRNLKIELSSCQSSLTSIGHEKETKRFCLSKSQQVEMYAKRFSQGHWTYCFTTSPTIQGNRSPNFHECQCLESWNPEKVERKRHHTLQCECFEHKALFSESFTQQISSVSTEQFQAGVKSSVKSRMRKSRFRKGSWQK